MPGKMICEVLIEAFMAPHKRLKGTERGQRLIDSVNFALESRFPHLKNVRRHWNFRSMNNGPKSPISKTSHKQRHHGFNNRKASLRRNKNNNSDTTHRPHKRSRIVKDPTEKLHDEYNYERLLRRNMYKPNSLELQSERDRTATTTNTQKRFNIITPGYNMQPATKSTKKTTTTPWAQTFPHLEMRRTTDYYYE
ncbi:uncharacterized protein LOC113508662 [Trichoplusia ni]|nr:uncharacterized protein LOC113508662 [Trichoplusia ni]